MKAGRYLPHLLAGATLLLLVCNVLPASRLKHRLQAERNQKLRDLREESGRAQRLAEEVAGLRDDPFVLERALVEAWRIAPEGAHAWDFRRAPEE